MFKTETEIRTIQARCEKAIAKELIEMNRYANKKVDAKSIGAEALSEWKTAVSILRWSAYKAFQKYTLTAGKESAEAVNLDEVYTDTRRLLAVLGDVNGSKLYANAELVALIVAKSGREVNENSSELQTVLDDIKNAEDEESLSVLKEQKKALIDTVDNRHKIATIATENTFRLAVEHIIANIIMEQGAEDPAVIMAREEARKEARKAANKARRQEKRAAEKATANTAK